MPDMLSRSLTTIVHASVALGLTLLTTLWVTPTQAQQGADQRLKVTVERVQFKPEQFSVEAVGSARAKRSVTIYPAVADKVVDVNFSAGQRVQAGDILVELDSRRQQVAVNLAKVQLADAQRSVERLQRLRRQPGEGAIPQQELDDAITQRDMAEIELQRAQTELEDRYVRAPFDGVVGITDIEVGDRINEQTVITSIDDRSSLLLDFVAPESALSLLQTDNASLMVTPWQRPQQQIAAEIVQVDSRLNTDTRSIRARAELQNPDEQLIPGMSFRIRLQVKGRQYASIPESALLWGPRTPYIWVVEKGQARRVDVQIQQRQAGYVLVAGDIALDDLLIVEGVQRLRHGQPIRYSEAALESNNSADSSQPQASLGARQ
ncbi:efflux RND transporter periplasmic adaptor subunit [Idiomarina xiamenensis]|uniref:RND family efflux system membrane fusion protein n=1 Tax=Idiomarina xiamenensis 10-D-4 TaxID=740709 RepID=K2KYZ2_9GAMM|nr:efflux RND transporter periplasmic adaptor subunit [Idiomarina xiamenensis]EKE82950.1 RND family efflux system membrane fusion protein [Idiomarina xiamenensis 10-D-4]